MRCLNSKDGRKTTETQTEIMLSLERLSTQAEEETHEVADTYHHVSQMTLP